MDAAAAASRVETDEGEARDPRDARRTPTPRQRPGRAEPEKADPPRGMLVIRHGIYEVRTATG